MATGKKGAKKPCYNTFCSHNQKRYHSEKAAGMRMGLVPDVNARRGGLEIQIRTPRSEYRKERCVCIVGITQLRPNWFRHIQATDVQGYVGRNLGFNYTQTMNNETAAESFARTVRVLDDPCYGELNIPEQKAFYTIAHHKGAQTQITPDGFTVLWPFARVPFRYHPHLAPNVLATLRRYAPSQSFADPFELSGTVISQLAQIRSNSDGPRWFWVTRTSNAIVIECRPAELGSELPTVPTPLPPWQPAEKVFQQFEKPRSCTHCGATTERFRMVKDVLICHSCGRSERLRVSERTKPKCP